MRGRSRSWSKIKRQWWQGRKEQWYARPSQPKQKEMHSIICWDVGKIELIKQKDAEKKGESKRRGWSRKISIGKIANRINTARASVFFPPILFYEIELNFIDVIEDIDVAAGRFWFNLRFILYIRRTDDCAQHVLISECGIYLCSVLVVVAGGISVESGRWHAKRTFRVTDIQRCVL